MNPACIEPRKASKVPQSPEACPLCGEEMGLEVTADLIYSSVDGPYAKLSVRFRCSECRFLDSRSGRLSTVHAFEETWEAARRLQKILERRAGESATSDYRKRRRGLVRGGRR